jgi:outer membrane porin, OprD family
MGLGILWPVSSHAPGEALGVSASSPRGAKLCLSLALIIGLVLGPVGGPGVARAADDQAQDIPLLRRISAVEDTLRDADPFFRDTGLNLHLRTYYFGQRNPDDTTQQAWAGGGWLEYKSGWWQDSFQIGGTLFGTGPIYAPAGEGGTGLLEPEQQGFVVAGVAYGALRYQEYATLTGFRQLVDTPYINPYDSRMVPNTVEAVAVEGRVGWAEYLGGYLWSFKPRDSNEFNSFSEVAGVPNSNYGAALGNLRLTPLPKLILTLHDSFVPNTFNTLYLEADYTVDLAPDLTLGLGAQYTDQRAVGQDLLANSAFKEWVTYAAGGQIALTYKGATLRAAMTRTGPGNDIQSPFGSYPGFINQLILNFDQANEFAWLLGLAYDFRAVGVAGLAAAFSYTQGVDIIDPTTRTDEPNQREYDLSLSYALQDGPLRGLRFDAQGGIAHFTNAGSTLQLRLALNYEFNLL